MAWLFTILVLLGIIALLGHFGFPEKAVPMPPTPAPERIMDGAGPWRFEGESGVAFLVCHGFEGSAFNTRPLGEFLHGLGHTAIGVLLPGHGTTIEDMNQSRFEHWRDHLEKVYLEERGKYRHMFLVGFSMGGTLCLDVAGRHADSFRPAGIITISSPVFFNGFYNGKIVIHSPGSMLSGLISVLKPVVPKATAKSPRPLSLERMNPWLGYRGNFAMKALHSFKLAFRGVRAGLSRISAPYCSIMAANDQTVSPENQVYIYHRIQSREKRAINFIMPPDLSTMHSLLTHKEANTRVFRFIESFIEDVLYQYDRGRAPEPEKGFISRLGDLFKGPAGRRGPENLVREPAARDRVR